MAAAAGWAGAAPEGDRSRVPSAGCGYAGSEISLSDL